MAEAFITESLYTPVKGEYDVIVCGGGVAGVAAAVAASRNGARTLLLEKSVMLGGLATLGLISYYEPICDGNGRRVLTGMPYELLRLAIQYSYNTIEPGWLSSDTPDGVARRCGSHYSYSIFAMALDEFVKAAGVDMLLDTLVVNVCQGSRGIAGVVVENKSGRGFYSARCVIDATGDADIARCAGVECAPGLNYLTYVAYRTDRELAAKAGESGNMYDVYRWCNPGSDLWGNGHPEGMPYFTGIDAESETQFILEGRRRLFKRVKQQKPGSVEITALPGMAQYRKSRRIVGAATLREADVNTHCPDSIGVMTDFVEPGLLYEAPYGMLYSAAAPNLFAAGRLVSADGWAWDVARVIPNAVVSGQAAGTAAALCVKAGCLAPELAVADLQRALRRDGVTLHFE